MPTKRTSAFSRALQEAQSSTVPPQDGPTASPPHSDTATPLDSATVPPSHSKTGETVAQQDSNTAARYEAVQTSDPETATPPHRLTVQQSHSEAEEERVIKTSFYPTQDQLDKLDDLASAYNKRYRRQRPRINRNDIVRYLIDQCEIDNLADLHSI